MSVFQLFSPAAAVEILAVSDDLKSTKKALRKHFLELRTKIDAENRLRLDRMIADHVRGMDEFQRASVVAGYVTDGTEPDVIPLLRDALRRGSEVCLPKWNGTEYILSYVREDGIDRLEPGKWGLMEPVATVPVDLDKIGGDLLLLVPGVAFDEAFARLGRGGGIYDRFLSAGGRSFALGVFYECQKTLTLPREDHDAFLDAAVTESGVRKRIT
ncbi:MAG: 5-formyltetrahydrofolate cyclo-ligase [Lentisphaerae bacterium]|nr:5-formyltetrahydrofolate cyclo-ligase [Lentisphaerota bacterium]